VDFAVTPHINSKDFPERKSETLQETASGTSFPVYGLQDDSAIVINGSEQRFIGSKPYRAASVIPNFTCTQHKLYDLYD